MHMDEKILKAKRQMEEQEAKRHSEDTIEKELNQSIFEKSITIYGIPVKFSERLFVDNQVSLHMPEDFIKVSEETIKQAYFLGNTPQCVLANDYLYFSVGLNYTNHIVANGAIGDFSKLAKTMIERVGPQVKIFETDKFYVGEYQVATMEFLSQGIDQSIYNQIFYASIQNNLLIGFINFPGKYVKRLKPLADEIVRSFKIYEMEEDES